MEESFSESEADFRSAVQKDFSKGLCSLIGFAMCNWLSIEAKHMQRQGEIFLRLGMAQVSTLKIETLLVVPFGVSKGTKVKIIQ